MAESDTNADQSSKWSLSIANGVVSGIVGAIMSIAVAAAANATIGLTTTERYLLATSVFFGILSAILGSFAIVQAARNRRRTAIHASATEHDKAGTAPPSGPFLSYEHFRRLLSQSIFDVIWQRRDASADISLRDLCAGIRSLGYPATSELSDDQLANAVFEVYRLNYIRDLRYVGGAFSLPSSTLALNRNQQVASKSKICSAALQLLEPTITIALDSGSTLELFAQKLAARLAISPKARLRVVTSSVAVCEALATWRGIERRNLDDRISVSIVGRGLSVDGGTLDFSLVRPDYEPTYDLAFVGAAGVDREGFYVPDNAYVNAKRFFISHTKRAIVLADSTKLGRKFPNRFGDWGALELLCDQPSLTNRVAKRNYIASRTTFASGAISLDSLA